MATYDDKRPGNGLTGGPKRPGDAGTGIYRDPSTGEEFQVEADWRPEFQSRLAQTIGSSLWMITLYMLIGAIVCSVLGIFVGIAFSALFYSMGLFEGINQFFPEFLPYVRAYYEMVSGAAGFIVGMGLGMRYGVVAGNVAVCRAVLVPALESALKQVADDKNAPRGLADRFRAVPAAELLKLLHERIAVLENHVEGFGISKIFRRYVSVQTEDYVEELTRTATVKLSEGPEQLLQKEHLARIRDAVVLWIKKHTARGTLLIIFTFVVLPCISLAMLLFLPALSIFLISA